MTNKRKHNVVIVGAGLFGCIAAALARAEGHRVTLIGKSRPYEASPASGCVLAPSWLNALSKADVASALAVLGDLYRLHDLEFRTHLGVKFKAQRVHTPDVLVRPDLTANVTKVTNGKVWYNDSQGVHHISLPKEGVVLVAAGIWTGELVDIPPMRPLYGCSLRIKGQAAEPRLSVYAPYRQAVMFNMTRNDVWFGDGTALIQKTWEAEFASRITSTKERAAHLLEAKPNSPEVVGAKVTVGARPYVEGHKAGFYAKLAPRLFVSTGGAKNGTVLAALHALRFVRDLQEVR